MVGKKERFVSKLYNPWVLCCHGISYFLFILLATQHLKLGADYSYCELLEDLVSKISSWSKVTSNLQKLNFYPSFLLPKKPIVMISHLLKPSA